MRISGVTVSFTIMVPPAAIRSPATGVFNGDRATGNIQIIINALADNSVISRSYLGKPFNGREECTNTDQ